MTASRNALTSQSGNRRVTVFSARSNSWSVRIDTCGLRKQFRGNAIGSEPVRRPAFGTPSYRPAADIIVWGASITTDNDIGVTNGVEDQTYRLLRRGARHPSMRHSKDDSAAWPSVPFHP